MSKSIKKDDTVVVLSGKDKGRKGKILKIIPDDDKVVIEKIGVVKRHQRPTRDFQGGIIEKPLPISRSKVMLVCSRCGKPTKIGAKILEDGKRVRTCKKCNEIIDKI